MIQFVLSLSVNQIACLKSVQRYSDSTEGGLFNDDGLRHWHAGTRLLLAERLIEWIAPPEEMPAREKQFFRHWRITEKGRLVLKVIELDIQDSARAIEETSAKLLPQGVVTEPTIEPIGGEDA